MRRFTLLVLAAALTSTALAQEPERRRMQPPPDHWMTADSLAQALDLTTAQKTSVTGPYTALNGVLRDAAERRREIRARMQGAGTFVPGQEPTPEMRARMDSIRTEMEGFQAEADQWLAAIRNNLTPEQQTKFDALPPPQVMRRGMGGGPPRP